MIRLDEPSEWDGGERGAPSPCAMVNGPTGVALNLEDAIDGTRRCKSPLSGLRLVRGRRREKIAFFGEGNPLGA